MPRFRPGLGLQLRRCSCGSASFAGFADFASLGLSARLSSRSVLLRSATVLCSYVQGRTVFCPYNTVEKGLRTFRVVHDTLCPWSDIIRMSGQNGVLHLQYCGKQSTIFWLSTQHFVPLHSNRLKLASDDPLLDVVFVDWLPHQSRAQVSAQCLIHQKDDAIIFSANAAGWLAVGDSLAQ